MGTSAGRNSRDAVELINNLTPAADYVKLGAIMDELITKHNALCVKLDADVGVTDTNYASTLGIATLQSRLAP
ncbi:hypothetical protein [Pseudomonas sp.]|uniref:hypothetical protein n=1 Tax=Pseudomonas sp. TaxID=306 RepID=UPI00258616D6|nr:hypothetical protein [Pseudomonas sp.]